MSTTTSATCQICDNPDLREIDGFADLFRVTSDSKPWPQGGKLFLCRACAQVQKSPSPKWREEVARIYADYALYPQGEGAEQAVFDGAGQATSRSEAIVTGLHTVTDLPSRGSLLDIGCGNGAFLTAFSRHHPEWDLHGNELDTRNLSVLEAIPGFSELHTGEVSEISGAFNLVSLIHVLEHIETPSTFLAQVRQCLLAPGARLLVQVPDWQRNPFDLLIADHLLHFTILTLTVLTERSGLTVDRLANDWVPKELSLLAHPGETAHTATAASEEVDHVYNLLTGHIAWLAQLARDAKAIRQQATGDVGLFGTSNAAAWLFGTLSEKIDFFVDEDPNRIGRSLFGRPIYAPEQAPANSEIFIPLVSETANRIAERLGRKDGPRYTAPKERTS